jgi:hypothetical protein
METSLHRSLKSLYATPDSQTEAVVCGYRADVLCKGLIVEIQASPLGAIARKVADLLRQHRVLVVKPITRRKVLVRRRTPRSDWVLRRFSPKTGKLLHIFDELVHFTRVFPHPNLAIEIVLIDEEEFRIPRRRRRFRQRDYRIHDRHLTSVVARHRLITASDLLDLLPPNAPSQLTSRSLSEHLGCTTWFARRVAYTLRHCGAARVTGKIGNQIVYELMPRQQAGEWMVAC